uniref:Uncharacterized protein n=1 Tax=Anguilla anguilla TaxID=7936 RepID=A0A0E9RZ29_ANGAN
MNRENREMGDHRKRNTPSLFPWKTAENHRQTAEYRCIGLAQPYTK